MKTNRILSCALLFLSCSLYAKDNLDINSILYENFSSSGIIHFFNIKFNKDNSYIAEYSSEGVYWYNKGKFEVRNNKIILIPKICKEREKDNLHVSCELTLGKAECKIEEIPESYDYRYHLICNSMESNNIQFVLPVISMPYKEGYIKKINGVELELAANKLGLIIEGAKFRAKPSIQSEEIHYGESYDGPFHKFIPKGTKILILAKTKAKMKVKNWENHWYYIEIFGTRGWVFGEFVEIK